MQAQPSSSSASHVQQGLIGTGHGPACTSWTPGIYRNMPIYDRSDIVLAIGYIAQSVLVSNGNEDETNDNTCAIVVGQKVLPLSGAFCGCMTCTSCIPDDGVGSGTLEQIFLLASHCGTLDHLHRDVHCAAF